MNIVQQRRQRNAMMETIARQGTIMYQMKSFFAPKSFPPPPPSIHGKLDRMTREELYRFEHECKESEIKLATTIATNNMLRAETKKYHMIRREWKKKRKKKMEKNKNKNKNKQTK